MADIEDVRRIAMNLPEVAEGTSWGHVSWKVAGAMFVWERPLRKTDLAELGERAPQGEIAGVRIADVGIRPALLQEYPALFTIAHFADYPSVLIRLAAIEISELDDLITEAWLLRAPKKLSTLYLQGDGSTG